MLPAIIDEAKYRDPCFDRWPNRSAEAESNQGADHQFEYAQLRCEKRPVWIEVQAHGASRQGRNSDTRQKEAQVRVGETADE